MKEKFKITGFKTPDDYFDQLEERVCGQLEEKQFPKTSGYRVPEEYFQNLEDRIPFPIIKSKNEGKIMPLFPKKPILYASAVAACLVLGVAIFNVNKSESNFESIQLSTIDSYIEEGNLNLDLYELTSYMESTEVEMGEYENRYIPEKNLESYLLENTDEELLMDGF